MSVRPENCTDVPVPSAATVASAIMTLGAEMSIVTVLEISAREGKVEELKAILKQNLGDTRARPGCESVTVHQDQANANAIVLIEHWASRADDEAYRAWRAGPGAIDGLGSLVAGPPSIRYFDDVDA